MKILVSVKWTSLECLQINRHICLSS